MMDHRMTHTHTNLSGSFHAWTFLQGCVGQALCLNAIVTTTHSSSWVSPSTITKRMRILVYKLYFLFIFPQNFIFYTKNTKRSVILKFYSSTMIVWSSKVQWFYNFSILALNKLVLTIMSHVIHSWLFQLWVQWNIPG